MKQMCVLLLPLIVLSTGITRAGDRGAQSEAAAPPIEETMTTIEPVGTPHAGLTEVEKAKLETSSQVSAEESENVRMSNLPQAEPNVIEATGKRAKPVAHPGEEITVPEGPRSYPGMTAAELEKLNQEPVPTSNSDGIDNAGKELVPTDDVPGELGF